MPAAKKTKTQKEASPSAEPVEKKATPAKVYDAEPAEPVELPVNGPLANDLDEIGKGVPTASPAPPVEVI